MSDRSIVMMSGLATQKAFDDVIFDAFRADSGVDVTPVYDPTTELLKRIGGGERFDVLIAATPAFADLIQHGLVSADLTPIVRAGIGVAVRHGAPRPVIETQNEFVEALLAARSVAYSRAGQSGIYFVELVKRLGIADEVLSKATALDKGFSATALVTGDADLAIQQLSELMFVPEADIVGGLPDSLQKWTEFSAGISRASVGNPDVRAFVDYIAGPQSSDAYLATALEPLG
jgi:molybdate transport system substrate-binding protein